jgi:hypothetical protein
MASMNEDHTDHLELFVERLSSQQVILSSPNFETAFCGLIILWLEV